MSSEVVKKKKVGRPRSNKHRLCLWVTGREERMLRAYLEKIRQGKNDAGYKTLEELEAEGQSTIFDYLEE